MVISLACLVSDSTEDRIKSTGEGEGVQQDPTEERMGVAHS